jgi:hypothetical protein
MSTVTEALKYEAFPDKVEPNAWRVEANDIDRGDVYIALFMGPLAQERAEEYARFKNGS